MKRSFSILLTLVVVAFAIGLSNCGNDSHTPALTKQFAFVQPPALTVAMTAAERHFAMENPGMFRTVRGQTAAAVGPKSWANGLKKGSDSVVLMNNDGSGQQVVFSQVGWVDAVQEGYDGKTGVACLLDNNSVDYQVVSVDLRDQKNPKVTQITTGSGDRWSPQISWDGKKVVFVKYVTKEGGRAMLMNATGGAETEIPTPFNVSTPSFLKDGRILFEQEDNDSISVMNPDGSGFKQLTNPTHVYRDEYPSVSPDGKTIVFARYKADESTGEDIWTANIDGTNVKQLTTDGRSWDPMFVNDKIVFLSERDAKSTSDVYSMNQDGSSPKRLTNDSVSEYFDNWW